MRTNIELSEINSELERKVCSDQERNMRNYQNVIYLLKLSEEQAEHLGVNMLGDAIREEQLGIKYRSDQRTGQRIIEIPSEWSETNIASTEFEKESFESYNGEACWRKENDYRRAEQFKKFDKQKELGVRELM